MVARTGLFVAPLPGTTPQGTSPTDGRLVLGALFGTGGGCIAGGAFTASATQMQITVASSVWRIPDPTNSAAAFLSPADPYTFAFSAGPASGSRKDVLWVKQDNYENGDADSRLTYGIQVGVAASPGTEPAITTAGAMKIGVLTVPAGVTNAAACTFVPTYGGQSIAAPSVVVATEPQLPAAGAYYGQLAIVLSVTFAGATFPCIERWNGTSWARWDSEWWVYSFNPTGFAGGYNAANGWNSNYSYARFRGGRLMWRANILVMGNGSVSGNVTVQLPAAIASGAQVNGTAYFNDFSDATSSYLLAMFASGTTLLFYAFNSGTVKAGNQVNASNPVVPAQSDQILWELEFDLS